MYVQLLIKLTQADIWLGEACEHCLEFQFKTESFLRLLFAIFGV